MDKDWELDLTKSQLENAKNKLYWLENEHDVIEKLIASGMSCNAIGLYLHIRRMDNIPPFFIKEGIYSCIKESKEAADKALQELDNNGWVTFGIFYAKHSKTEGREFIRSSFPMDIDE